MVRARARAGFIARGGAGARPRTGTPWAMWYRGRLWAQVALAFAVGVASFAVATVVCTAAPSTTRGKPPTPIAQVRGPRHHPPVVVLGLRQGQFRQNAPHVLLHGALGHPQPPRDTGVGASLRHQPQHLTLPRTERRQRV